MPASGILCGAAEQRDSSRMEGFSGQMNEYDALKKRLASGWNTWNTRSVLSHVLLPEAFSLNVCFKTYSDGNYLREALVGREEIYPGPHAYDGSYSELRMVWNGLEVIVQSAR